ncbi:MAG: hypothetical protein ABI413_19115 [Ktedonobacteraceae bacterium]
MEPVLDLTQQSQNRFHFALTTHTVQHAVCGATSGNQDLQKAMQFAEQVADPCWRKASSR